MHFLIRIDHARTRPNINLALHVFRNEKKNRGVAWAKNRGVAWAKNRGVAGAKTRGVAWAKIVELLGPKIVELLGPKIALHSNWSTYPLGTMAFSTYQQISATPQTCKLAYNTTLPCAA